MTGRTCPVHGEYSESGACRWCEPETEKYSLKSVDAVTHQSFIDRTNQAIADLLGPPPDVAKILRTYKPEFLTRIGFTWIEAVIGADMNAEEESCLATEHAALRWERVARRWEWKTVNRVIGKLTEQPP